MAALRREAAAAAAWREFVITSLDGDIGAHVTGAAVRHGRLTVLVDSAAWAARVRLAATDIMHAAQARDPAVAAIAVRIAPPR